MDADVIVFAGDVHTGKNGIKWILNTFPNRPVIYVLGNHEFYGQKIPKLISDIKEVAQGTNIHVLENNSVEIGDVVFLGATLWTDFRLNGDPSGRTDRNDRFSADSRDAILQALPSERCATAPRSIVGMVGPAGGRGTRQEDRRGNSPRTKSSISTIQGLKTIN